jgi:hypothetical protein
MLVLKGKFLEAKNLPPSETFSASTLISVLAGTDTLHLIGRQDELAEQLEGIEAFDDIVLELRWRKIDLASLGGSGRGKAYRLSIVRLVSDPQEVAA